MSLGGCASRATPGVGAKAEVRTLDRTPCRWMPLEGFHLEKRMVGGRGMRKWFPMLGGKLRQERRRFLLADIH